MTKTSYPLPPETGCENTYVSLPIKGVDGKVESITATVDGQMSAAACRWLADKLDAITSPPAYVVVGHWPDFGVRVWDRGVFETPLEAQQAWDAYVAPGQDGDILEAKMVRIGRMVLSSA